jgi:hypothetical protein
MTAMTLESDTVDTNQKRFVLKPLPGEYLKGEILLYNENGCEQSYIRT